MQIHLKSYEEAVKPGITTKELDRIAEEYILASNTVPSFKGYGGFPATICTSVNEEVMHGILGNRVLHEGDIISIDCGAILNGYQGDTARAIPAGNVSKDALKLIDVTEKSFFKGVKQTIIGNRVTDKTCLWYGTSN